MNPRIVRHRYTECNYVSSLLDPFHDAIDWLAGYESVSRVADTLIKAHKISADEARKRARRAAYFAGIAVDFIDTAAASKPHVAALPVYYAYLNMCKLMIGWWPRIIARCCFQREKRMLVDICPRGFLGECGARNNPGPPPDNPKVEAYFSANSGTVIKKVEP